MHVHGHPDTYIHNVLHCLAVPRIHQSTGRPQVQCLDGSKLPTSTHLLIDLVVTFYSHRERNAKAPDLALVGDPSEALLTRHRKSH